MPIATITLTTAGIDALVDAQNAVTAAIEITQIGLANASFIAAPTLTALPNEFKRIGAVGGQAVSENMIHMAAQDSTTDVYTAYGLGLYLADGTLFGTYAQVAPLVNKVSIASFLISLDVAFMSSIAAAITFGNANFLNPPATETVQGVARIATNALADAGVNDATIMSPKKVKRVLDALAAALAATIAAFTAAETAARAAYQVAETAARTAFQTAVNAALAALAGRTITGTTLASGGGDLTADRTIDVPEASGAELLAATVHKAVSAWSHGQLARLQASPGYEVLPGGLIVQWGQYRGAVASGAGVSVTFPTSFNAPPFAVLFAEYDPTNTYNQTHLANAGASPSSASFLAIRDDSGVGSVLGFDWLAIGI